MSRFGLYPGVLVLLVALFALFANACIAGTVNPTQLEILKAIRDETPALKADPYLWTDATLAQACDNSYPANGIRNCDANGWVIELDFSEGVLPASKTIAKCSELQSLTFSHVSGSLPSEWSSLTKLTQLRLLKTETNDIPASWASLQNLVVLFLAGPESDPASPDEEATASNRMVSDIFSLDTLNLETKRTPKSNRPLKQRRSGLVRDFPSWIPSLPRLLMLEIGNFDWNGEFPQSLATHASLFILRILNTPLTGTLPTAFANNQHLQRLIISGNAMNGTIPNDWSHATSLDTLAFWIPGLSGSMPAIWPPYIANVVFQSTQIAGTLRSLLAGPQQLSGLATVMIRDNPLIGGPLDEMVYNRASRELVFSGMSFTTPMPATLLYGFERVALENVRFPGALPEPDRLPQGWKCNLDSLRITNVVIGGSIPEKMASSCPELVHFHIANSGFSGTIPGAFTRLEKLRTVRVIGTNIYGQIPDGPWSEVRYANLSSNAFTGTVPFALASRIGDGMDEFDVSNNMIDVCGNPKIDHVSPPNPGFYSCIIAPQNGFATPSDSCKANFPSRCTFN